MENRLIAVVDDEEDILELLTLHLTKAGYKVKAFSEPGSFFKFLNSQLPALVILDLMIPGMDGYEICKKIKSNDSFSQIPVIMLTAKSEEVDKVLGLELGADDYVTKPFSPRELTARVKAVLRRNSLKEEIKTVEFGGILKIIPEKYEVLVNSRKIDLTTTEFKILEILVLKKGLVYSREKLLDSLWGSEKAVLDRTIDVHIKNLREKLGAAGKFIKNIRGIGYKLECR
ncbi:MAG: two-component system response regulator [Elusimicrobia bacterium RIFOXYA2_FULL_39_19]|nr:MAG: two-component system response regulator [Elusimicrobia bacterium RIFOXYA2_FULL_39_19]